MTPPEPLHLLRQAVAAMLGRSCDDPVVVAVAVCYQEACPAFEQVIMWRHGAVEVVIHAGQAPRPAAKLLYPVKDAV